MGAHTGACACWRKLKLNHNSALSGKHKSLIGLAVSCRISCGYCIIADTEFSKLNGATDAETTEAVAMDASTRHMSTLLNGLNVDDAMYKSDLARLVKGAQAS